MSVYFAKLGIFLNYFVLKFGSLIIVRIFGQTKEQNTMKSNFKYQDGTETFTIKTGEVFTVEQDINGFWGYTSNKGYNLWEGDYIPTTKTEAVKMLREYEKTEIENAKYN